MRGSQRGTREGRLWERVDNVNHGMQVGQEGKAGWETGRVVERRWWGPWLVGPGEVRECRVGVLDGGHQENLRGSSHLGRVKLGLRKGLDCW